MPSRPSLAALAVAWRLGIESVEGYWWRPLRNPTIPYPNSRYGVQPQLKYHYHDYLTPASKADQGTTASDESSPQTRRPKRRLKRKIRQRARRIAHARRDLIRQDKQHSRRSDEEQLTLDLNVTNFVELSKGESSLHDHGGVQEMRYPHVGGHRDKGREMWTKEGNSFSNGRWRGLLSLFVSKPFVEVHSVKQLSWLLDVKGYNLEDLSVLCGDREAGDVCHGSQSEKEAGEERSWAQRDVRHPVVQAVLDRVAAGTLPSMHGDGRRIGLALEGGGMRGCVSAGMVTCLHYLGLADGFDCVYGSSAGSLGGAFFISRQVNSTVIYHDLLPCAGSEFLDLAKLPQALGLSLPKPFAKINGAALATKRGGRKDRDSRRSSSSSTNADIFKLQYLLGDVVDRLYALDFETFHENDRLQPLHMVASGVESMTSVSLASHRGDFSTLDELRNCMRASMLVPGMAGPPMTVYRNNSSDFDRRNSSASVSVGDDEASHPSLLMPDAGNGAGETRKGENDSPSMTLRGSGARLVRGEDSTLESCGHGQGERAQRNNRMVNTDASVAIESEPFVDALVFQPLPYRSAVEDGCTDVVVLCSRPEGSQVLRKKPGLYEKQIVKRYFEQQEDPESMSRISNHLRQLKHVRTYAEDVLVLAEGTQTGLPQEVPEGGPGAGRQARLVAVMPKASCKEVGQLEMNRKKLLQGCRDGFAALYDLFGGSVEYDEQAGKTEDGADVPDSNANRRKSGADVALEYFPDSILSTPADLDGFRRDPGRVLRVESIAPADQ